MRTLLFILSSAVLWAGCSGENESVAPTETEDATVMEIVADGQDRPDVVEQDGSEEDGSIGEDGGVEDASEEAGDDDSTEGHDIADTSETEDVASDSPADAEVSGDPQPDESDTADAPGDPGPGETDAYVSCEDRVCGPDPVTHVNCGICSVVGLKACNDGVCEAVCDPDRCGLMGYSENTCAADSECDGSPSGGIDILEFSCNTGNTECEAAAFGLGCGVMMTDCLPCDLSSVDDGVCWGDVCVAPASATYCF